MAAVPSVRNWKAGDCCMPIAHACGSCPGSSPLLLEGRDFTQQRERLLDFLLTELKTRWKDFEFIKEELGNLLGLLGWAVATGQWANVAALGRAIDPYLTLSGHWDAWHKTLKDTREAADAMKDLALQGWVLHQLGTYEIGIGNLSAAQKLLEQAVRSARNWGSNGRGIFTTKPASHRPGCCICRSPRKFDAMGIGRSCCHSNWGFPDLR